LIQLPDLLIAISDLDPADMPAVLLALASRLAAQPKASSEPEPTPVTITASDDRLLTVKEAAARLRKDPKWIYRGKNELPFMRRVGGSLLISERALERWIERQKC
jgi:excisionase family DNA binding protein